MSASSGPSSQNRLSNFHRNTNSVRVDNVSKNSVNEILALFNVLVGQIRSFHEIKDALGAHLEVTFFSRDAVAKALCMTGYNIGGAFLAVTPITNHTLKPPTRLSNDDRRNLYVLGLPFALTKSEFAALFSRYGAVSHCVILATVDNSSRRRGFVVMSTHEEAKLAMSELTRTQVKGHTIDVSWAVVQRSEGFLDGGDRAMLLDIRNTPPPMVGDGDHPVNENPTAPPTVVGFDLGSYTLSSDATPALLVLNLPAILFSQTQDLEPLFYPYGSPKKLQIAGTGPNGALSVFVEYHTAQAAQEAKEAIHGQNYVNCQVAVQFLQLVAPPPGPPQGSRVGTPSNAGGIFGMSPGEAVGPYRQLDPHNHVGTSPGIPGFNEWIYPTTPNFNSAFQGESNSGFPPGHRNGWGNESTPTQRSMNRLNPLDQFFSGDHLLA